MQVIRDTERTSSDVMYESYDQIYDCRYERLSGLKSQQHLVSRSKMTLLLPDSFISCKNAESA